MFRKFKTMKKKIEPGTTLSNSQSAKASHAALHTNVPALPTDVLNIIFALLRNNDQHKLMISCSVYLNYLSQQIIEHNIQEKHFTKTNLTLSGENLQKYNTYDEYSKNRIIAMGTYQNLLITTSKNRISAYCLKEGKEKWSRAINYDVGKMFITKDQIILACYKAILIIRCGNEWVSTERIEDNNILPHQVAVTNNEIIALNYSDGKITCWDFSGKHKREYQSKIKSCTIFLANRNYFAVIGIDDCNAKKKICIFDRKEKQTYMIEFKNRIDSATIIDDLLICSLGKSDMFERHRDDIIIIDLKSKTITSKYDACLPLPEAHEPHKEIKYMHEYDDLRFADNVIAYENTIYYLHCGTNVVAYDRQTNTHVTLFDEIKFSSANFVVKDDLLFIFSNYNDFHRLNFTGVIAYDMKKKKEAFRLRTSPMDYIHWNKGKLYLFDQGMESVGLTTIDYLNYSDPSTLEEISHKQRCSVM